MASLYGSDAYAPEEIARIVEEVGVKKANLGFVPTFTLGVMAGCFIGLGSLYYTLVSSDPELGFAAARVLGGLSFSLGYVLAIIAGAEVFTGNNLLVMAWAGRRISTRALVKNWSIVFVANAVGALTLIGLALLADFGSMNGGLVGEQAIAIAAHKTHLPFWEALAKGILANLLICLGVWIAMAGRSVIDKFFAIAFPISAFTAAGFEQSTSNMFFIPYGILLSRTSQDASGGEALGLWGFFTNMAPVTLGNIIGGGIMVALVYYIVYRRVIPEQKKDVERERIAG